MSKDENESKGKDLGNPRSEKPEKRLNEKLDFFNKATRFVAYITAVLTLVAGTLTLVAESNSSSSTLKDILRKYGKLKIDKDEKIDSSYVNQLVVLRGQITKLNNQVAILENKSTQNTNITISELNASVKQIDKRLLSLEKLIMDSPEKALTIPLMKHDLEHIKDGYDKRFEDFGVSLAAAINQLYTILGTVTVVIGVGLLGALLTARK